MVETYDEFIKIVSPNLRKRFYSTYKRLSKNNPDEYKNVRDFFTKGKTYWNRRLDRDFKKQLSNALNNMSNRKEAMRTKPKSIKSGNVVLFRDGHCGMVVCCNNRYYIMHKKKDGLFVMRDVLDRYSDSLHHIHDSSQDILSIVAPKSAIIKESQWKDAINGYANIEIVFENKEKTISMKEIAELLDCDVKDVIITK